MEIEYTVREGHGGGEGGGWQGRLGGTRDKGDREEGALSTTTGDSKGGKVQCGEVQRSIVEGRARQQGTWHCSSGKCTHHGSAMRGSAAQEIAAERRSAVAAGAGAQGRARILAEGGPSPCHCPGMRKE